MCTRTACKYGGKNIAFHVNEGSTPFWLSLLIEFEDGEGDIGSMQLKQVATFFLFRHSFTSLFTSVYCLFIYFTITSTIARSNINNGNGGNGLIFCLVGTS
jgi:hypothetical protein